MKIKEYKIIRSIDKENMILRDTILKNEKLIYETSYKLSNTRTNSPINPIDIFEAAINGEQITIIQNHNQELQNIAFELHLLNSCKETKIKFQIISTNKFKNTIKKMISLFT